MVVNELLGLAVISVLLGAVIGWRTAWYFARAQISDLRDELRDAKAYEMMALTKLYERDRTEEDNG